MSLIPAVIAARRARFYRSIGGLPPSAPDPGEGGLQLMGVGSQDNSLTAYPITPATTVGDYYVDPESATHGDGSFGNPWNHLNDIHQVADGSTVLVRSGTLTPSSRYIVSSSRAVGVNIWNYGTERPVIDCSLLPTGANGRVLTLTGSNEHWKGFEIINGTDGAQVVYIDGSNYMVEDFWVHDCLGDNFYVANFGSGASNNLFQDCVSWALGDGVDTDTNAPDGIAMTGDPGTPTHGNRVIRCFVGNAPDDGIDCFRARNTRILDSVTYRCGWYGNGNVGADGNGLKMGGGDNNSGDNFAIGCATVNNRAQGGTHNEARNDAGSDPNVVFAFLTVVGNNFGLDIGGDQTNHMNVGRDTIFYQNGGTRYVGANAIELRTTVTLDISNPQFASPSAYDYSLAAGSPCTGAGQRDDFGATRSVQSGASGTSDNLGASVTALRILKAWAPVLENGATPMSPSQIHGV